MCPCIKRIDILMRLAPGFIRVFFFDNLGPDEKVKRASFTSRQIEDVLDYVEILSVKEILFF